MNGFLTAATSPNSPVPPPNPTSETSHPSFPTTRPDYSSFKFKNIGQPPTLLSRFSDVGATPDFRSSSPERSDMEVDLTEDPTATISDDHRTFQPAPRKSLLDMLGGSADQSHNPAMIITQAQGPTVPESIIASPPPASPSKHVLPRPESRLSSISRQISNTADIPRVDPVPRSASIVPDIHTNEPSDSDMVDFYADPDSPSHSPFSLFSDLSEAVKEAGELQRITDLHRILATEREELLRRHEETTRSLSRTKSQLDHVLSLTDEAVRMTTVFVDKEKARLETKKSKAEAKIERRKNLEVEQRRRAKELERIRQQEEERRAQVEVEQQAERQRLEEQRRREEALAAERQRLEEIQARERAQAEERSRIEEEERRRIAEEDQKRRDEEERIRKAEEEQRKQEEERTYKKLAEEREAAARKQEERKTQILERRREIEEERRRKQAEAAAAKAEAEKRAAEKEQQRTFQERRAAVSKDEHRGHNRPEAGSPPIGSSSTLEGTLGSSLPSILVNDVPKNPQLVAEHHPGLAKINRARDTPTFVPASTEAGRLPPDLSQQVKVASGLVDRTVKHEAISPVITPFNPELTESKPPTPLPSRPASSSTATAPTPATLPVPPHLPPKPVTIYSQPPIPLQQRGRSPRRRPPQQSRSRSRSSSRSQRRGSRTSRSPESARGRYRSPSPGRGGDHYSPPRYRDGGSRYNRDSRSGSPLPPPNPRKRALQTDSWASADTPSKLDYSHPAKRRAASPLRSKSPPSPRLRPLTQPPPVIATRRPPAPSRRGRGPPDRVPLEMRLSRTPQPHLSERIR